MRARRFRSLIWLLPALLLAAQWLTLAHGVLHARGAGHAQAGGVAALAQPAAHADEGWLARLFAGHEGSDDCRLYDQVAGGDHAPPAAMAGLPAAGEPRLPPRWVQRAWAARVVALFQARAPPALG
ncbi:MAG: hypothetical protein QM772_01625 [Ottowia sp.]|uniref:hypothetical protein n=1 Tax=Ottowia sp. TaxID=1898956 RepID=UPI0039E70CF6